MFFLGYNRQYPVLYLYPVRYGYGYGYPPVYTGTVPGTRTVPGIGLRLSRFQGPLNAFPAATVEFEQICKPRPKFS
jgi:hypothetical protein